ncbi:trafficking protein Mon1-domain-containing protein [Naematelia encephala]|uniref:Vacuolar fusion protein MON1 n=1 Tax=Naematelia encephala TaxID=71784 RepID=A0A1Y2AYX9_9TREE|nr:trafficking protein Mon1-domain-containing protein [Naematelia encephala]
MSPHDDRNITSVTKRHLPPFPPTPHRTTSQLSTTTVSAGRHDTSSRKLLSQTFDRPANSMQRDASSGDVDTLGNPRSSSQLDSRNELMTPSSSRPVSIRGDLSPLSSSPPYQLDEPAGTSSLMQRSTSFSSSSSHSSSRKGKERAIERLEFHEVEVSGESTPVLPDGGAARELRSLVRNSTMDAEVPSSVKSRAASLRGEHNPSHGTPNRSCSPRRYYVLTDAGKPVFASSEDSNESMTSLVALAQTLISIFAEDDDRIRSIIKGGQRIAFVLKTPLYLFCVSDWGEPEHVLRVQLEYIHLHILSVVTSTQLSRAFQRRSNFDPTRLLEGTDNFLRNLIARSQYDFSYLTSTLQPLRMPPALRDTAAAALMPPARFKDLLYVLLVAGGHIVTLLRPRKHSIHPSDLHLLLNTLASSTTLRSSETWLPICFPKFNPAGFVHAYISFVLPDVGLVFVSADRDAFEDLRGWKDIVMEKLETDKTLAKIQAAIPQHEYSVSAVGSPGLRHFIYKSRQHVQITSPAWEAPYDQDALSRQRVVTMYQRLHDAVHSRSGQSSPLKLVYTKSENEACLAWITKPFELYITVTPHLTKSAVVAAANSVARWMAGEEGKVFLKDAPVF